MDALEKIIRRIVEGQIRGLIKEHPSILNGVDWYKGDKTTREQTLIGSLSKRIVGDLTCATGRARLAAVLWKNGIEAQSNSTVAPATAAKPGRMEVLLCAPVRRLFQRQPTSETRAVAVEHIGKAR